MGREGWWAGRRQAGSAIRLQGGGVGGERGEGGGGANMSHSTVFSSSSTARRAASAVDVDAGCDLLTKAVSVGVHGRRQRLTTAPRRPPPAKILHQWC